MFCVHLFDNRERMEVDSCLTDALTAVLKTFFNHDTGADERSTRLFNELCASQDGFAVREETFWRR